MEYETEGGKAFIYFIIWAGVVFIAASTWHLWRYLDSGDTHNVIKAKATQITLASFFGAMIGFWLTGFLLVLGSFLDAMFGMTEFGLMEELGTVGVMVVFFACTQASTGMYLLKDDHSWRNFLRDSEHDD